MLDCFKDQESTKSVRFSLLELLWAAESLVEPVEEYWYGTGNPEYRRGMCELIGRLMLDWKQIGSGTAENAEEVARYLGLPKIY